MARAIKFKKGYGQVKVKGKGLVGGFRKDEVWPTCSAALAQKLVSKGAAEFVEGGSGDVIPNKVKKATEIVNSAKEEAKAIIDDAEKKAEEIIQAATDLTSTDGEGGDGNPGGDLE